MARGCAVCMGAGGATAKQWFWPLVAYLAFNDASWDGTRKIPQKSFDDTPIPLVGALKKLENLSRAEASERQRGNLRANRPKKLEENSTLEVYLAQKTEPDLFPYIVSPLVCLKHEA